MLGKTGERTLSLVFSVPYLRAWLQVHPDRSLDQWLFAYEVRGRIVKPSANDIINTQRRICKRARLRNIHPHMLRHSGLTEYARWGRARAT